MSVSISLITTPEKAENLIKMAARDRKYLLARRDLIDLSSEDSAESMIKNQQDLVAAQAQMDYLNTVIASLPEGDQKYDEITKQKALEVRIRKLTSATTKDPATAQLEKEYEAIGLEGQINGINAFIDAVTARKLELQSTSIN